MPLKKSILSPLFLFKKWLWVENVAHPIQQEQGLADIDRCPRLAPCVFRKAVCGQMFR
jgi:hypothetical protein